MDPTTKENHIEPFTEKLLQLTGTIIDWTICIYLALMLAVFPFYNVEGYSHIGTDKSFFFCKMSMGTGKILAFPLLLYLILRIVAQAEKETKIRFKISLTDFFALLYCAALLLSYAFTDFREAALWGEKGWYMGLAPQLILLSIYFLVSRFWRPRKLLFYIFLPVSGAVFLMGCFNRFGIYAFGLESAGPSFISTIGNINWYCGYAVSVMFVGLALLWLGGRLPIWQKAALMLYTAIAYMSLILQGSDSGVVALAVLTLAMFVMSAKDGARMLIFWAEMAILWGSCLGICVLKNLFPGKINLMGIFESILISAPVSIFMTITSVFMLTLVYADRKKGKYREKLFRILTRTALVGSGIFILGALLLTLLNTLRPGNWTGLWERFFPAFRDGWGSSRGITWQAGWECFIAQDTLHKLVGAGPDCMWSYINSGKSPELLAHVQKIFPNLRLTNAHNEWLTILADTGILGLAGYGGMIICGIRELLRPGERNPIATACGFGLLAYTVNNIFSFQQSMSVGTVFVLFGMGKCFLNSPMAAEFFGNRRDRI